MNQRKQAKGIKEKKNKTVNNTRYITLQYYLVLVSIRNKEDVNER